MESQPQNPEFRINPENFTHANIYYVYTSLPSFSLMQSSNLLPHSLCLWPPCNNTKQKLVLLSMKTYVPHPHHIYSNLIYMYLAEINSPVTGPRSAVGNVSGYRCVSDCRSRGCEFDPGPVPYFLGD